MAGLNLCAVLHGVEDLRLEERPVPQPAADEVLIAIRSVGICGSDSSLYRTARVGPFPLKRPIVLGHEPCGVITAVGADVTSLAVGDRVTLSPHEGCGACPLCNDGRYNLCPEARMMATPPTDGALANFVAWPARLCFKLPRQLTWAEGAFVQPIALAVYGCERAGVKPGHRVMVCGAGPLGTVMVLAAKASGATHICVTDISWERLQFLSDKTGCSTLRADEVSPHEIADRVRTTLGRQADVAIECSGAPSAVSAAIYATKPGGCILLGGLGPAEVQIPLLAATSKEVDIRSMLRFTNTYPAAIDLMASRQIDVKPLVTHIVDLKNVVEAFEMMVRREKGKIIIRVSQD